MDRGQGENFHVYDRNILPLKTNIDIQIAMFERRYIVKAIMFCTVDGRNPSPPEIGKTL